MYNLPIAQTSSELLANKPLLASLINIPFLGIPKIYITHTARACVFQGRLVGLEEVWQAFTEQLAGEFANFVLVVR